MATGILFALTVVLVAAACYVGLLLVRRPRHAAQEERPRTVGDLVRGRSAAPEDLAGGEDLSGTDLFTPKAAAPPLPDDSPAPTGGSSAAEVAVPRPTPRSAATPPGGVEVGDAPWRRAARMMGSEPGGAWETAPMPVVAAAQPAAEPAAEVAHPVREIAQPARAAAQPAERSEAGRTAVLEAPAPIDAAPAPAEADRPHQLDSATDATDSPAPVVADVVDAPGPGDTLADPAPADVVAGSTRAGVVADPEPEDTAAPAPAEAPSRPLSDPDLTPLMGIPVVRPLGETPIPPPAAEPEPERATQPVTPRLSRPSVIDDEVVSLLPAAGSSRPRAAVTGSAQPIWFRVVRRDGEPVGGVLVTLLDDHGQEADATKTATDGGGELRAPHGGWFLMIASADGFQPRAVTLAVDEKPVEIALLLPRSSTVAGVVRSGGAPATGTRVVAFQEGEVVDELVTDPDGGYRFDDLAEGVYALSAVGVQGSVVDRVTVSEGADVHLDLDLRRPDGAPTRV